MSVCTRISKPFPLYVWWNVLTCIGNRKFTSRALRSLSFFRYGKTRDSSFFLSHRFLPSLSHDYFHHSPSSHKLLTAFQLLSEFWLAWSCAGNTAAVRSWGQWPCHVQQTTTFHNTPHCPPALKLLLLPLPWCFPNLRVRACMDVSCSAARRQLPFLNTPNSHVSALTSAHYKGSFSDQGWQQYKYMGTQIDTWKGGLATSPSSITPIINPMGFWLGLQY